MSSVVNQTFFFRPSVIYKNLQNIQISNMNISHSEQLSKVNALQDNVISNVDFKYSWVSFHAGQFFLQRK